MSRRPRQAANKRRSQQTYTLQASCMALLGRATPKSSRPRARPRSHASVSARFVPEWQRDPTEISDVTHGPRQAQDPARHIRQSVVQHWYHPDSLDLLARLLVFEVPKFTDCAPQHAPIPTHQGERHLHQVVCQANNLTSVHVGSDGGHLRGDQRRLLQIGDEAAPLRYAAKRPAGQGRVATEESPLLALPVDAPKPTCSKSSSHIKLGFAVLAVRSLAFGLFLSSANVTLEPPFFASWPFASDSLRVEPRPDL